MTRSCVHHSASSSTRCPDQQMFPVEKKNARLVFWCIWVCEDWANMQKIASFSASDFWKTLELGDSKRVSCSCTIEREMPTWETGATNSRLVWFRLITWRNVKCRSCSGQNFVGPALKIFQQICLHLLLRSGFSVAVASVLDKREVTTGVSNNHTECKNFLSRSWNAGHCRGKHLRSFKGWFYWCRFRIGRSSFSKGISKKDAVSFLPEHRDPIVKWLRVNT